MFGSILNAGCDTSFYHNALAIGNPILLGPEDSWGIAELKTTAVFRFQHGVEGWGVGVDSLSKLAMKKKCIYPS